MAARQKNRRQEKTQTEESDENPHFTLHKRKFNELTEYCPESGAAMLKRLFEDFFAQWSKRVIPSRYGRSLFLAFLRLMAVNGVPIKYNMKSMYKCYREFESRSGAVLELSYKMPSPRNIKMLFEDISRFEALLREHFWFAMHAHRMSQLHKFNLGTCSQRREIVHFVRELNYRAMANYLSYSRNIRKRKDFRYYIEACASFNFANQVIIANNKYTKADISEKLFELAQNASKCITRAKNSSILAYFSECLISFLVLGYWDAIGPIIALEQTISKTSHYYKHIKVWRAYKYLAQYFMILHDVGGIEADHKILAQHLIEEMKSLDVGSIFGEVAIRLLTSNECQNVGANYDELIECLALFSKSNPRRAAGLIEYLRSNDLDEEVDIVIENACQKDDSNIHPSESIWLEWCERRIVYPIRYGPIEEVYAKVVKVLFSFLDYGKNRGNERAWKTLHLCLPNVDREIVAPLWKERVSWWPIFHKNNLGLSREARHIREQVISVLLNEITA